MVELFVCCCRSRVTPRRAGQKERKIEIEREKKKKTMTRLTF